MRIAPLALLFAFCYSANALCFEVERPDDAQVTNHGETSNITIGGTHFLFWEVPSQLDLLEVFSEVPGNYKGAMARTVAGEVVTYEEAVKIIEAHYKETAFDFDSMKVRNITLPGIRYITWCTSFFVTCGERAYRAGTWVELEVNAKNRLGGMTGFERATFLITKLPASTPPDEAAAQVNFQGQAGGRIPQATAEQLKRLLSDGVVIVQAAIRAKGTIGVGLQFPFGPGRPKTGSLRIRKLGQQDQALDNGSLVEEFLERGVAQDAGAAVDLANDIQQYRRAHAIFMSDPLKPGEH